TELTNSARAEVEQTLEWARAQASSILARAQHGAEQLLAAAGMGEDRIAQAADAIVRAAEASLEAQRHPGGGTRRPVQAIAAPPRAGPGVVLAEGGARGAARVLRVRRRGRWRRGPPGAEPRRGRRAGAGPRRSGAPRPGAHRAGARGRGGAGTGARARTGARA